MHGLKRKTLGLFNTSTSMALLQKLAKNCPSAQDILSKLEREEEKWLENMRISSGKSSQSGASQRSSETSSGWIGQSRGSIISGPHYNHAFQVYKKNLWIKLALIEDKLVEIVEYLAKDWFKYYDSNALMADTLSSQIFCSLLVGPSALKFSLSKSNEYHFEDPTAPELIRRHRLANPIACLCQQENTLFQYPSCYTEPSHDGEPSESHACHTVKQASAPEIVRMRISEGGACKVNRRRPLSLKSNARRATLITNCHHYSCQEISEHQQTRGYSLRSTTTAPLSAGLHPRKSASLSPGPGSSSNRYNQQNASSYDEQWSLWSPKMLHEILHQNSKFKLLYAKNNVLLETQTHQLIAGYLSLHQTSSDLILKWIPNQMINGGQTNSKSSPNKETDLVQDIANEQKAIESSYLDLVVSVSVSHIVLLHCQFKITNSDAIDYEKFEQSIEECLIDEAEKESCNRSRSPNWDDIEETLILVEADGVQRAPIRFPKGGLRHFLSCLQTGLAPDRYLDPAINFDDHEWSKCNPLSQSDCIQQISGDTDESSNPSNIQETSKLDSLFKRLPSLKMSTKPNKSTKHDNSNSETNLNANQITQENLANKINSSSRERQSFQVVTTGIATKNYVYRIVSVQQADWSLPTPPDVTSSVASSPSCFNGTQQRSEMKRSQRFRWNLRRWTGFGQTNSTSEGSTSSQQTFNDTFDQITATTMTTTTDETSSFSMDQHEASKFGRLIQNENSLELSRVEAKLYDLKKSTSDDVLEAFRTQSIQTLCDSMRKQIQARAFYGWLAHCRRMKLIHHHLSHLIKEKTNLIDDVLDNEDYFKFRKGLTLDNWRELIETAKSCNKSSETRDKLRMELNQFVYYGSIENDQLRYEVWPYLLGYFELWDTEESRNEKLSMSRADYEDTIKDWSKVERVVRQRDSEILAANMAKLRSRDTQIKEKPENIIHDNIKQTENITSHEIDNNNNNPHNDNDVNDTEESSLETGSIEAAQFESHKQTENCSNDENKKNLQDSEIDELVVDETRQNSRENRRRRWRLESTGSVSSDASITDQFGNNIHRIDKDVQRCDRSFWYFKEKENLTKLRNIMYTYVWKHLDVGYVQGMCDLAAPFLVIFDEELLAFSCFSQLMRRMVLNFPHGSGMDKHFEALRYLMQVLDPKLFEILQCQADNTQFYFCYRWLLLDFKRGNL